MNGLKKNRFIPFFLAVFLIFSQSVLAQHFLDSLQNRLRDAKSDTERVYSYYDLADYYAFFLIDSSKAYTKKATDLSEKMHFDFGTFYAYHGLYYAYITLGNYPKAIEIALENLVRAEKLNYERVLAFGIAYGDLALAYRIMQNYEVSMDYARKATEYFAQSPTKHPESYGSAISQIGLIKLRTNRGDSALYYLQEGYKKALEHGNLNKGMILSGAFLGDAYSLRRDYREAGNYYFTALSRAIYANNMYLQARLLNNLSSMHLAQNNQDSGIYYAYASLQISQKYHFDDYAMATYRILGNTYEFLRLTDSSLKYTKLTLSLRDSLFSQARIQQFDLFDFNEKKRQQDIATAEASYRSRLRVYGLLVAFGILLLLAIILYRNNLQRKKTNQLLSNQKANLQSALEKLQATQSQLVQAEKMASLGEITAGIAHEIQNPLNFVNNFSEVNQELATELREDLNRSDIPKVYKEEWIQIIDNIEQNQEKINQHGKRADAIVKNMLQHSAISTGQKEPTDLNSLTDEYLKLAYYGFRAKDKSFNIALEVDYDRTIGKIDIAPRDLGRALLNLFNNAFYYVNQKHQGNLSNGYEPCLKVSTRNLIDQSEIRIRDNGPGISSKLAGKIFQPFFTTKPTGQGTGLGLSLAYDIITKEHGGSISVESTEGEYTEFIIQLPSK